MLGKFGQKKQTKIMKIILILFFQSEFLVDLIQKLFDPSLNLFRKTSNGHLYPSSMTEMSEINHLDLVEFCGKMLAKAIFEVSTILKRPPIDRNVSTA